LAGDTTTDFIDRVSPATTLALSDDELRRAGVAAALWVQGEHRVAASVLREMPSGWRNGRLPAQHVGLRHGDHALDVRYQRRRDGSFDLTDGTSARVHAWSPRGIDVEVDGHRRNVAVTRTGHHLHVQTGRGTVTFDVVPRFVVPGTELAHGGLAAPMPGVVLEVRCQPGDTVEAQQTLVVLEAMKMEHHVKAPAAGVVAEVKVVVGQHVENGTLLVEFEAHEDDAPDGAG
jgi:propionyl-CoA carboxylase alpha chain